MTEQGLDRDAVLPRLRQDLQLKKGTIQKDGTASWLIYDPLRNRYFQISRQHLGIIQHWEAGTPTAIVEQLNDAEVSFEDIEELLRFFFTNALTQDPPAGDVKNFVEQYKTTKRPLLEKIIHNYLFIRIPLLRPHHFLKRTVGFTDIFFTRAWSIFVLVLALVGGYLTLRQWDAFVHTFLHFFNLTGLIYYFLALVFVKVCHEMGHAYTATRYGCRVPTMGMALLVMFPVLYTDTTDSWKLTSRRQRLMIAGAGVLVELTIAVFATFCWAFFPDGVLRSAAFFIATTSWIMSIAVNLNPFMRFDGYHFLSDLIGIQNLQARSFAIGRWGMREFFFNFGDPIPEALSHSMRRGLMAYAWLTWVYRFFLFLGIALLVHALFFKALGIFLFIVEIGWFIMIPIFNELKQWFKRREDILANGRVPVWAASLIILGIGFFMPWHSNVRVPAVFETAKQEVIYGRDAGKIVAVHVKNGDYVEKGAMLISLHSEVLETEIGKEQKRVALLQARLGRIVADREDLEQKLVLQQELIKANEALHALQRETEALNIEAPFAGVVSDLAPALHTDRWINENIAIATLISENASRVRGFVAAKNIDRVDEGAKAIFIPYNHEWKKVTGTISKINASNADVISIGALASRYGGPVAVSEASDELTPLGAWYSTIMDVKSDHNIPIQEIAGQIHVRGKAESFAVKIWRRVVHIFIRETTF